MELHSMNEALTSQIKTALEAATKAMQLELIDVLDKLQKIAEVQKIKKDTEEIREIIRKVDDVKRNLASASKPQSDNTSTD